MPTEKELMAKQELLELKQDKLTPGQGISIDQNNVISATGGGGGGSTVTVTPIVTTGTKIATITVDDVDRDLYAPGSDISITQILQSGIPIASIVLDGTTYMFYTPDNSNYPNVYFGTTDPSDSLGYDKDFYYKLNAMPVHRPQYNYLKMVVYETRSSAGFVQLSMIQILDDEDNLFSWTGTTATSNKEPVNSGETASSLIDNDVISKACIIGTPSSENPTIFTFTLLDAIDTETYIKWCWYTGNDENGRDPITFDFLGSEDGETWDMLTTATSESITTSRRALAYTGEFDLDPIPDIQALVLYL